MLARLRDRDIPTIDADEIVHDALGRGTATAKTIAAQFGGVFVRPDGSVDRSLLAGRVFGDGEARLNSRPLFTPSSGNMIRRWFDASAQPMGVALIPLLYETNHERDFDFVVVTFCPPEIQLQRILDRDHISEEEALQRIAAQMPAEEKAKRANFVIRTDDTKLATDRQVEELLIALRR